ncbi:hypothetical protein BV22DRAFT_1033750 [Leucogyrophana mollusca]|uniref:Uncharacterized protein n=1 Tax=Leucogyrophana mollusca TaxID=85980 RepID=A0ACB8BKC1_9AGAM|nr:hypothetical protein BV22DRAFT_1033750 [Leucogyrophana mollusca]
MAVCITSSLLQVAATEASSTEIQAENPFDHSPDHSSFLRAEVGCGGWYTDIMFAVQPSQRRGNCPFGVFSCLIGGAVPAL